MLFALLWIAADPVPAVVMTRSEAQGLSPRELQNRLLANFPHGRMLRVEVPQAQDFETVLDRPLDYVSFHEAARPVGGRFCAARRIIAQFDTLDGRVESPGQANPTDVPRRLFAVTGYPLLAVLDDEATVERCAAVTKFAQMPSGSPQGARRLVADVLELAEQAKQNGRAAVPVTCVNETRQPYTPCDGVRALVALDWKTLGNVDAPSRVRGPTTQMWFGGRDFWWLDVTGDDRVERIALRLSHPPPF